MVDASLLNGWSYEKASCFGMPHFMARYTSGDVRSYERDADARCMVCGRPATETHHEPNGRLYFTLRTKRGIFVLKPALIALCRECHDLRTKNGLSIRWSWNSEVDESMWWDGYLLSHGYRPHDGRLLDFGRWVIS